ncbi:MAG: molybdopterin-dependent oxidoreductase, partial [Candidatus Competibacterales bacterium]|nr:molybdopterin-dependent oxidoreductase [Candidatus Competibacterales bacterium]
MSKPSVCPLDCPDTCSLAVEVEDDRITAVRGSRANPFTAGAVCRKVATQYPEFVHGPHRLRHPLRRTGPKGSGRFEPIGWDEALDRVHAGIGAVIDRYGPQAVAPFNYAGPHGLLAWDSMSLRFFHRLGATRLERGALCGGVRGEAYAATFGPVPGTPPQQVAEAGLVIVWGNNVSVCNLHLLRHINAARRRGARLVVIDPRRIRVAARADLHLAVRPGTDVILAWALAAELERIGGLDRDFIEASIHGFEPFMARAREYPPEVAAPICGVEAEAIRTLARWYRDTTPAVIAWGNGPERNRNGGSGLRAICALPALAGKFGVRGGGLVAASGHAFPRTPGRLTRPDLAPPGTRSLSILDVPRMVLDETADPPLRGLFIYNHNPLVVHPDQNRVRQALAHEALFTVGIDLTLTDSLRYADVILPACTHFEHADLFPAYGQQFLQRAEPVIPPVGESLPNTEIFRRLAARFGFDEPALRTTDEALMDEALDRADPRLQGQRPSALPVDRALAMHYRGEEPVLFRNVLPGTPSGRIELLSDDLATRRGCALPDYHPVVSDYPLTLISPAAEQRTTSTFGALGASDRAPPLQMHPDDASARGLTGGDRVRVWTELGEVHLSL